MTTPDRPGNGHGDGNRSGPRLPGPERRKQLLGAARVAFARTGFHETSMNDVAAAAGVTKPVVYQRFESKRALYREVLEDIEEHRRPDGRMIYVQVLKAPVRNAAGEIVGVQGIF